MSESGGRQQQHVSIAAATAIVVATMVGTGVFVMAGYQVQFIPSGFPVLMLWVLGGIAALCGVFCYAELATMMPRSGGEYHLLGKAYHPLVGFLAGWVSITAGFAAPIAAGAKLFGSYSERVVPQVNGTVLAVCLILGITIIQLGRIKLIDRFQIASTIIKVLLILAFVAGALWMGSGHWNLLAPKAGDSDLFLTTSYAGSLIYVMYAYTGWNCAVYVAGEMQNPKRDLPKALVLGTIIVMALYLALNAVYLVFAPWSEIAGKEFVAIVAGDQIFGPTGGVFVAVVIALGLIPHVNALLLAVTRVMSVVGEDEPMLRWFNKKNRAGAPWLSVILIAAMALTLMSNAKFSELVEYIQVLLQLCALLAVLAVPWLRFKLPKAERPFKTPLYPLPPIIFSAVTLWIFYSMIKKSPAVSLWCAITVGVGVILYFLCRVYAGKNPDSPKS